MAIIEWVDDFSVNISIIDEQHKKLIAMLNKLNEAMQGGKGRSVIGSILEEMAEYAQTHFKTEEDFFEQYQYPETEQHIKQHEGFLSEVSRFTEGYAAGDLRLTIEVLAFLTKWLRQHIIGSDKKYSGFLNDKGVH